MRLEKIAILSQGHEVGLERVGAASHGVIGQPEEIPDLRIAGQIGGRHLEQRDGLRGFMSLQQLVAALQRLASMGTAPGGRHQDGHRDGRSRKTGQTDA